MHERMADVGGVAALTSRAGAGTTVVLRAALRTGEERLAGRRD